MTQKYITSKQPAALLNVTTRTLYDWRKRKLLVPKTVGGKLMYTPEDIENAIRKPE